MYMGEFWDRQQLTYLRNVRDTPTVVPIPPSLRALHISRNVSWFTFLDPKKLQQVRIELGSEAGTLTTGPYNMIVISISRNVSRYLGQCGNSLHSNWNYQLITTKSHSFCNQLIFGSQGNCNKSICHLHSNCNCSIAITVTNIIVHNAIITTTVHSI